MFSRQTSNKGSLELALIVCSGVISIILLFVTNATGAQPSPKVPLANEILDDRSQAPLKDEKVAEQSFRQFIQTGESDSTVIGELKSNASASELMMLRNKIADTILSMQEKEGKHDYPLSSTTLEETKAECYIEVTRVEKIPGKCKRANGGQPICQSNRLMSISSDCSW